MHDWISLAHVRWDCKYDVVLVPKYRKKALFGKLRRHGGELLRDLCRQPGVELLESHLMAEHVHMCLRVPPRRILRQYSGTGRDDGARVHQGA